MERLKLKLYTLWNKIARKLGLVKEVFYIGGSDVLPPPLNSDEEAELIKRLMDQDPEAKATLIERNLRLVVYIARKFENTGICVED